MVVIGVLTVLIVAGATSMATKVWVVVVAALLVAAIGVSRLYLGGTGPPTCWRVGSPGPAGYCSA